MLGPRAAGHRSQAAHVWSGLCLSWRRQRLVIVTAKPPEFLMCSMGLAAVPAWRVGVSFAWDEKGAPIHCLLQPPRETQPAGRWVGGSSPQSLWHLALWAGPGVERGAGMLPALPPPPPTCWHVVLFSWGQAVGGEFP